MECRCCRSARTSGGAMGPSWRRQPPRWPDARWRAGRARPYGCPAPRFAGSFSRATRRPGLWPDVRLRPRRHGDGPGLRWTARENRRHERPAGRCIAPWIRQHQQPRRAASAARPAASPDRIAVSTSEHQSSGRSAWIVWESSLRPGGPIPRRI